ncbi:MAG: hypothetical protein HQK76_15720 [Desulfobacterales bacterium]|nr:hypothetical protein [Desulfobacterales bacterium]
MITIRLSELSLKFIILNLKKIFLIIILFMFFLIKPSAISQTKPLYVYFYSSETNINNYKSLKMEFDKYLSKYGEYEFQPFERREDFEEYIKNKNNCLILLSSWHYSNIFKNYSLKPILVGVQNNKCTQKRILVGNEKSGSIETAMKGPIASSSNEEYSRDMLKLMFPQQEMADKVRILSVPKDIDALMSVSFNMAKAGLSTENMLNNLKSIDPILSKKIKTLAEGKDTFLTIVAMPEKFTENLEKIISVIKNLPNDSLGLNIIKSLNLDSWKPLESSDKITLEEYNRR